MKDAKIERKAKYDDEKKRKDKCKRCIDGENGKRRKHECNWCKGWNKMKKTWTQNNMKWDQVWLKNKRWNYVIFNKMKMMWNTQQIKTSKTQIMKQMRNVTWWKPCNNNQRLCKRYNLMKMTIAASCTIIDFIVLCHCEPVHLIV